MTHFLSISHASWRHALWLIGPLAVQVLTLKITKITQMQIAAYEPGGSVPDVSSITVQLTLAVIILAISAYVVLLLKYFKVPAPFRPLGFLLTVVCGTLLASLGLGADLIWWSVDFLEIIRYDVLEILVLGLCAILVLEYGYGLVRKMGIALLHIAIPVLITFSALEFAYFIKTGSLADAFMLRYFLTNLSDLRIALLAELTPLRLTLLAIPIVATAVPLVLRSDGSRSRKPYRKLILAGLVVVVLIAPARDLPSWFAPFRTGTFSGLVEGLIREPVWESPEVAAMAEGSAPPFDTEKMTVAGTARTDYLNVLIIILESQRSKRFLPDGVTPFLDSLRTEALVVKDMHAVVPHTNKALVPILCGIYPSIVQDEETQIPGRCLPELLAPHGYRSAFFTPATLEFEKKGEMLANMGFETVVGREELDPTGFSHVNHFGQEERVMYNPSLDWIDRVEAGSPFLLTYLTLTPHYPYGIPQRHTVKDYGVSDEDYNYYLNTLAYVDGFVSELFRAFQARNLIENTLFVLVGDHGEAFGAHGLRFHSAVPYDDVIHVPALLFNPMRFPDAGSVTGLRHHPDLVPTITDVLGLELRDGALPGSSLLTPVAHDRRLYHAGWVENQSMALRVGSRKYVYHYRRKPMEVYDVDSDPYERSDKAVEVADGELEAIEMELLLWRKRVNEQYHGGRHDE